MTDEPEELTVRKDGIPGLQIMEVFTLCGLLAALGCKGGGVTSILVAMAKAWATAPPNKGSDTSTSTGELTADGATHPFKPATLSSWDERARWEWPRRMNPTRRVRISQPAKKNGRRLERREE